jgi:hypothetical protein
MEKDRAMREEPTIRRGVRNARYAAIPNHVFEETRLSMEARWLLGYLLSKPDNWTVVLRDISNKGNCGRDKARRMIAELVELGYAQKEQARDGGRFSALSLVIYDEPFPAEAVESVASLPQTENPSTVNPSTEKPATANPPLVITDNLEKTDYSSERARENDEDGRENRKSVERAFKRAFHQWPTAISDSEPDAFRAWSDLTPDERQSAFEDAQRYIEAAKATGRKHVCSHAVYLREKRWEKLPTKAEASDNAPAQAAPFGKLWGARVYSLLLDGPTHQPGLTPIELGMIDSGRFTADHILRDKRTKMGFPTVNEILERAEGRRGVLVPPALAAVKDRLVLVKVGGDVWLAWEQYHRDVGWPWFRNVERLEWAYLPEGGPEGLDEFKAALRGLGDHDGN